MEAKIPFSGFYESKWSGGVDQAEEQQVEYLAEKHGLAQAEIAEQFYREAKYREAYVYVAEKYVTYLNDWLNAELGLEIQITFLRMTSPREYNFETDHIHVSISYKDAIILARRVGRNALRKAAKDLFTSRDGFISFYRNDPIEWGRLRGWDCNQLLAVFTAAVDVIGEEDYDWGFYETMSGNGVFDTALDKAVDYQELAFELGKLAGRKELLEEQEDAKDEDRKFPEHWRGTADYVAQYELMNKGAYRYPGQ